MKTVETKTVELFCQHPFQITKTTITKKRSGEVKKKFVTYSVDKIDGTVGEDLYFEITEEDQFYYLWKLMGKVIKSEEEAGGGQDI
jgi:hypothetical protein